MQMFTKMAELASEKVSNAYQSADGMIKLSEISSNPDIHPYLCHFFHGIAEERVYNKLSSIYINKEFGLDHSEISAELESLKRKMIANYSFSASELDGYAAKAAKSVIYFLTIPVAALHRFIFKNSNVKPYSEVLVKLKYFSGYDELLDKIKTHSTFADSDDRSTELIHESTFKEIVHSCETELVGSLKPDGFASHLWPLFEFCEFIYGKREIPSEILLAYFEEKRMSIIVQKLEKEYKEEQLSSVNEIKLKQLIEVSFEEIGISVSEFEASAPEDEAEQAHEPLDKPEEISSDDLTEELLGMEKSEEQEQVTASEASNEEIKTAGLNEGDAPAEQEEDYDAMVADILGEGDKTDANKDKEEKDNKAESSKSSEVEFEGDTGNLISGIKQKLKIEDIQLEGEYDLEKSKLNPEEYSSEDKANPDSNDFDFEYAIKKLAANI